MKQGKINVFDQYDTEELVSFTNSKIKQRSKDLMRASENLSLNKRTCKFLS